MNTELTDTCSMPLGVHKGKAMQDVPASYLIWYHDNAKAANRQVMDYIKDNWQALKLETK